MEKSSAENGKKYSPETSFPVISRFTVKGIGAKYGPVHDDGSYDDNGVVPVRFSNLGYHRSHVSVFLKRKCYTNS